MNASFNTIESARRLEARASKREDLAQEARRQFEHWDESGLSARAKQVFSATGKFILMIIAQVPESVARSNFRLKVRDDPEVGATTRIRVINEATDAVREDLVVTDGFLAEELGTKKDAIVDEVGLARHLLAD